MEPGRWVFLALCASLVALVATMCSTADEAQDVPTGHLLPSQGSQGRTQPVAPLQAQPLVRDPATRPLRVSTEIGSASVSGMSALPAASRQPLEVPMKFDVELASAAF